MQIEEPVVCRYSSTFHFHTALTGMLGPTLIGSHVVEVREPGEKCLLTAIWVVKRFHHEQLPLEAHVGFQGRGCANGVQPDFGHAPFLKPLFSNSLKNDLCCSDNPGA